MGVLILRWKQIMSLLKEKTSRLSRRRVMCRIDPGEAVTEKIADTQTDYGRKTARKRFVQNGHVGISAGSFARTATFREPEAR
jgi:hypothetical protein